MEIIESKQNEVSIFKLHGRLDSNTSPELEKKLGLEQGNGWRPLTELELTVREIDAINPHASAIRFNELDGDIGFMVSGGGYGLSSLEQLMLTAGSRFSAAAGRGTSHAHRRRARHAATCDRPRRGPGADVRPRCR